MFRVFLEAAHRAGATQGTSCIAAISRCTYRPLCREYLPPLLLYCCIALPRSGKREVRPSQRYPCRVLPPSWLLLTNRNQSASCEPHSRPARANFGSRFRCRHRKKGSKVLADLSCDRCLMQLTRVASHQTPGAVDEPIGVGFEVTMLLLQVPHPLPCHE